MKTNHRSRIAFTLCAALMAFQPFVVAASWPSDLQRGKDRVDVPAVDEGLCLHNLFQSNMVIQRDKPVKIWGWAAPGETVGVMLEGKQRTVTAGKDRSWKVTFPALPASSSPREILDYVKAGDKNVGFCSSYDMRRAWYHPGLKVPVGERMARWALASQYSKKIEWKPPVITGMKIENGKIVLTFDVPVDAGHDNPIEGFAIAGNDRRYQPATVEHRVTRKDSRNQPVYDYKTIVLSSRHVADPIHYRYAWARNPMGNLKPRYNFDSAILATQRSDDWKIYEVPVKFGEKADRQTLNLARQANRLFDMDRRLKNARYLLDEHQEENATELRKWKDR